MEEVYFYSEGSVECQALWQLLDVVADRLAHLLGAASGPAASPEAARFPSVPLSLEPSVYTSPW